MAMTIRLASVLPLLTACGLSPLTSEEVFRLSPDPQAWVAGIAPGSYYSVKFEKPGCSQLPYPVPFRKVSWLDGFRVQPKALTMVTVFIP